MSVLGGSATSRLFRNVREKQSLCYYCGSAAQRATGVMMIDSGVEPGKEQQAEAAIIAELEGLKNGPITQEEVDDCRRGLLSSMDALGDSLAALENWYYGQITRGEPLYPPEYGKVLTSAVSLDEVRQTLQSYSYSVCYAVTAEPGTQGKGAARMLNNDHESFAAAQARAAAAVSCESVVLPSGLTVLCRTMPGYSSVHAIYATASAPSTARSGWTANRSHCPPVRRISWSTKCARRPRATPSPSTPRPARRPTPLPAMTAPATCSRQPRKLTRTLTFCWAWSASVVHQGHDCQEQGIIGQEIKMYDDSPDWRLLNALFRCLYADHPLRDDIAGTVESIAELTPQMLYSCTRGSTRRPIWC